MLSPIGWWKATTTEPSGTASCRLPPNSSRMKT